MATKGSYVVESEQAPVIVTEVGTSSYVVGDGTNILTETSPASPPPTTGSPTWAEVVLD